ncbi:hypothetical protein NPIL_270421 [Nephila pilipes]|uniref:Uncharacterized protein n=1 Tax=Nephila pilipes TaxID=299642 RepID=A0A8X6TQX4_NEPPI|nr:hypothetical protein NPIL_270421 [Nephila pilipes]
MGRWVGEGSFGLAETEQRRGGREISPIIQAPTTLTTMATTYENLIDQDMYNSDCSSSRVSTPSIIEQPL